MYLIEISKEITFFKEWERKVWKVKQQKKKCFTKLNEGLTQNL